MVLLLYNSTAEEAAHLLSFLCLNSTRDMLEDTLDVLPLRLHLLHSQICRRWNLFYSRTHVNNDKHGVLCEVSKEGVDLHMARVIENINS